MSIIMHYLCIIVNKNAYLFEKPTFSKCRLLYLLEVFALFLHLTTPKCYSVKGTLVRVACEPLTATDKKRCFMPKVAERHIGHKS